MKVPFGNWPPQLVPIANTNRKPANLCRRRVVLFLSVSVLFGARAKAQKQSKTSLRHRKIVFVCLLRCDTIKAEGHVQWAPEPEHGKPTKVVPPVLDSEGRQKYMQLSIAHQQPITVILNPMC